MKFPFAFWIVALGFLIHQLLQKILGYSLPFIDSYFDPFAAAVLGLFALKMERRYLWKRKQTHFEWYEVVVITSILALISEQLFPYLSGDFTNDRLDYIAFVLGGGYFYWFLNEKREASDKESESFIKN